ncbi:MAG: DNA cytosine methyltransferase [Curvibacter sp.]
MCNYILLNDSIGWLTYIDLFSGCGGFSLGFEWAGLKCHAAIDFNAKAIETFKANHPEVPYALAKDLTKYSPKELDKLLSSQRVDLIVGSNGDLRQQSLQRGPSWARRTGSTGSFPDLRGQCSRYLR